jgi:hypothetical protein
VLVRELKSLGLSVELLGYQNTTEESNASDESAKVTEQPKETAEPETAKSEEK